MRFAYIAFATFAIPTAILWSVGVAVCLIVIAISLYRTCTAQLQAIPEYQEG